MKSKLLLWDSGELLNLLSYSEIPIILLWDILLDLKTLFHSSIIGKGSTGGFLGLWGILFAAAAFDATSCFSSRETNHNSEMLDNMVNKKSFLSSFLALLISSLSIAATYDAIRTQPNNVSRKDKSFEAMKFRSAGSSGRFLDRWTHNDLPCLQSAVTNRRGFW